MLSSLNEIALISSSGIFDAPYYLSQVRLSRIAPLISLLPILHFLKLGCRKSADPNLLFDANFYISQSTSTEIKGNALVHYLQDGAYKGLNPHPLFDSSYYLSTYPDVAQSRMNPLSHFLHFGWREGRNPHPLFDSKFYLSANSDLPHTNPLVHYILYGAAERRDPHPLFDTKFYLRSLGAGGELCCNPLLHYLSEGAGKGFNPHPLFDSYYYLDAYPDVGRANLNPLVHFLQFGAKEQRSPHPLFDTRFYVHGNAEAIAAINPLLHYMQYGAAQRLDPHPLFDTQFYLRTIKQGKDSLSNPLLHYLSEGAGKRLSTHPLFDVAFYLSSYPDVARCGLDPLLHFLRFGARERRNPHPLFDTAFYLDSNADIKVDEINPLVHYITCGAGERRDPHPVFDTRYYLDRVHAAGDKIANPLVHYVTEGHKRADCTPNPFFNPKYYLSECAEAVTSGMSPLAHFLWENGNQKANPNELFDQEFYLSHYRQCQESNLHPFVHYVRYGAKSGYQPGPLFDPVRFSSQDPVLALQNALACLNGLWDPGLPFDCNEAAVKSLIEQEGVAITDRPAFAAFRRGLWKKWYDVDNPVVSIVVLTRNNSYGAQASIKSVWLYTSSQRYELILCDNASNPNHRLQLRKLIGPLRRIEFEEKLDYVHSIRAITEVAKGEYIVLLQDEQVVMDGWLEPVIGLLAESENTGAVGVSGIFPDGRSNPNVCSGQSRDEQPASSLPAMFRLPVCVDYVSRLAIRKNDLLSHINQMSAQDDHLALCRRIRRSHKKIVLCPYTKTVDFPRSRRAEPAKLGADPSLSYAAR